MAKGKAPVSLLADWSRGMVRDAPRTAIPESGVYNSQDFLLHQPGFIQKRGGTSYAGPAMGSATYAAMVTYADFTGGAKVVAIGDDGHLYTVTSGSTTDVATLGSGFPPVGPPIVASDKMVIPGNDGATAPKKYDGSSVAALGGSPPNGKYVSLYKSRLILANTSANPRRVYFSPAPDIEGTWDTTNSWLDADHPVTGMAALNNTLLIFSEGNTERILGTVPPGVSGSDMDRGPLASVGCSDARSIAIQDGTCIFASPRGVYLTNGTTPICLTAEGLIESYWQGLFSGYTRTGWTIAGGLIRSFYIVTVMNGSTLVDTLMCHLPRRAWWRLTNVKGVSYARAVGAADELYSANRAAPRVVQLSGIFSPAAGNKNDADGTAVAPTMEMRLVGSGSWLKHYRDGRISYDMRDASSDNPTLAVTVAPGLEAPTYTAVAESPLAETSDNTRKRFTISKVSQGVSVKLTQTNASSKTEVYALEVDERQLPITSGGQ